MREFKCGYVYILTNWRANVLYVGVTSDLKRRIYEHKLKIIAVSQAHITSINGSIVKRLTGIEDAIQREKQSKAGSRRKKVLSISKLNPAWIDLYDKV